MRFFRSCLIALVFLIPSGGAPQELREGDTLRLSGKVDENLFAAGREIEADFDSTDDAFLAAGKILFRARTREGLFLVGGDLSLREAGAGLAVVAGGAVAVAESRFRELVVAGGDVRLESAAVADDLVAAGGKITLSRATVIGDSLVAGGGQITFEGRAGGNARFAAGEVTLAGTVDGNVDVRAGTLRVGPTAVIDGNLTHSTNRIEISPQARIRGQVVALPGPDPRDWEGFGWLGTFTLILFALGSCLVPPLLALLFPGVTDRAHGRLRDRFWESLGKGFLVFLLVPVALALLLVSLLGTPVALAALPFAGALGLLAWTVEARAVGHQVRLWTRRGAADVAPLTARPRFGWTLLGSFVILLVLWVPFLGFLFCSVLFLSALGALVEALRRP